MKGNNTLHINEATLIEAFQEYLDKRYNPPVTVAGVRQDPANNTFVVRIAEIQKPES